MAGKRKQRAPQSTLYSPTERAAEQERRQAARLPALAVYAGPGARPPGSSLKLWGRRNIQSSHVSHF
jgi:hypothetical protein